MREEASVLDQTPDQPLEDGQEKTTSQGPLVQPKTENRDQVPAAHGLAHPIENAVSANHTPSDVPVEDNLQLPDEPMDTGGENTKPIKQSSRSGSGKAASAIAQATTHTRRNANGTVGSVYPGNKVKTLKPEDGYPLWRKDIQLEFLRCVFEDDTKCFTMPSDSSKGHPFADVYIQTMARSSKTSKILKEKLLSDRAGALSVAMICLLVNIGRMNTTLNCKYSELPCL